MQLKLAAAATLCFGMALSGCGSGSTSTSSDSAGVVSAKHVAFAQAQVDDAMGVPEYKASGDAVDVAALKGKTIYSIPIDSSNPFLTAVEKSNAKIAKDAGIRYVSYTTHGQPAEWAKGVQQATSEKASVVILNGVTPGQVAPQVKAARAAGVKVMITHEGDSTDPVPDGADAVAAGNFSGYAKLMTYFAIAELNGKPLHALLVQSAETPAAKGIMDAFRATIEQYCGSDCSATTINVPIPQWATTMQSSVQSELTKNPSINYVLPIYDSMSLYIAPAIKAAGRTNVSIVAGNGTPAILAMIGNSPVKMNVAEDPVWIGYATMDQAFRLIAGMEPLDRPNTPLRVIDSSNVKETGTPPALGKGFGTAYVTGYNKVWGLS